MCAFPIFFLLYYFHIHKEISHLGWGSLFTFIVLVDAMHTSYSHNKFSMGLANNKYWSLAIWVDLQVFGEVSLIINMYSTFLELNWKISCLNYVQAPYTRQG
jgi:hypothetical protein